ncbi:hypothetical protein ABH931_002808 [Streptacidiphilus sp. MAP12-33]|uniref:hypothetical protein n=1 Tax=Streptacidiphilus sp. MAP12-33 TaxID=3156266 RepID=UPI0035183DD1
MNLRSTAVASAAMALAVAAATSAAAEPQSGHRDVTGASTHSSTTATVPAAMGNLSPHVPIVVGCNYNANAPARLTSGGPLYATSNITSCTTDPAPTECHLNATIEVYTRDIFGNWVWATAGQSADSGWGPCNPRKILKPSYTCQGMVEKKQYRNYTTLAILYTVDGKNGSSSSAATSGASTEWCN